MTRTKTDGSRHTNLELLREVDELGRAVFKRIHRCDSNNGMIYECKSYDRRMFWAQAHCNRHRAHITRIASVPEGMPFQQQVNIASQKAPADIAPASVQAPAHSAPTNMKAVCAALDEEVRRADAVMRQPISAAQQDYWRGKRKEARDEQFRIRCQ